MLSCVTNNGLFEEYGESIEKTMAVLSKRQYVAVEEARGREIRNMIQISPGLTQEPGN